ncbi:hypothetical protein [Listeria riparia]|uniref:Uncharacterized protein n=1 Tax=Listeria riparia FSL S10-1204 TaxID=1265816 RepID=W7D6W6_9LIST|nr:hypothetical protein [Listeria riparia]EUJ43586.1 hypothetical protein PRIP_12439 [Listeria riparia FSL S10-1204]
MNDEKNLENSDYFFSDFTRISRMLQKRDKKKKFYQLRESIEAKAWEIKLDQAIYTDERDQKKQSCRKSTPLKSNHKKHISRGTDI